VVCSSDLWGAGPVPPCARPGGAAGSWRRWAGPRRADRDGVVGPRPRVQHHGPALVSGLVQPLHHLSLVVGLPDLDLDPQFRTGPLAHGDQIGVRGAAVDARLPGAQPPEVGPVQHQHLHSITPVLFLPPPLTAEYAAAISDGSGPSKRPGLASPSSTTNRRTPDRVFLSTCMVSSSWPSASGSYEVGSPSES